MYKPGVKVPDANGSVHGAGGDDWFTNAHIQAGDLARVKHLGHRLESGNVSLWWGWRGGVIIGWEGRVSLTTRIH